MCVSEPDQPCVDTVVSEVCVVMLHLFKQYI